MAVANYVENNGHYPPAYVADANGRPLLSWRVLLLPWLDADELYRQFNLEEPWDGPTNLSLLKDMPQTFRLHTIDDAHDTSTNYVAITGKQTLWQGAEPRQPDFLTDEPGNTLLIAEFVGHPIPWSKPEDLQF
ncbi:MAG: DUF1559 domain-containing protein, partial [Planctomycetaceae bacterium]